MTTIIAGAVALVFFINIWNRFQSGLINFNQAVIRSVGVTFILFLILEVAK